MRFALSSEQQDFATSLQDLLVKSDLPKVIRSWGAGDHDSGLALWRRLGEMGVTALAVPEAYDGFGAGPVDLVVAFEALGRNAVPGPLVESIAAVPTLLTELGDDALAQRWLPGVASGETLLSLATAPHVPYALDADVADVALTVTDDGLAQATLGEQLSSVDRARRLFRVQPGESLAGEVSAAADRAFDLGALACASQLLGAGRALLEMAGEYAKQRVQYGQPIGQYQAIKHQLADVMVGIEMARPLLYGAALALGGRAPTGSRDVSAAKVACGDAAYRAARVSLQVHGAIGYTQEYDLSLWLTKVRALVTAWGTPSAHRARVMEHLCPTR
ncbi:MAG: acyl-CoA dehydrogenase family protein [Mycobacteriaceae bacterium]